MSIQQPGPPSHVFQKAHRRQRKPLRKLFLICLVVVIALLISVLLILNGMSILPGPWTLILTTITTLTGIVLAVFQAFPSLLQFSNTDPSSPQHGTLSQKCLPLHSRKPMQFLPPILEIQIYLIQHIHFLKEKRRYRTLQRIF